MGEPRRSRSATARPGTVVGLVAALVLGTAAVALAGGDVAPVWRAVVRAGEGVAGEAGAGASSAPGSPADADPRVRGIRVSLAAMTEGLRKRDQAAFVSAVDERVTAVRARAVNRFRALTALPLSEAGYSWSGELLGPAPSGPRDRVRIVVDFSYRLTGWDQTSAHDPRTWTFGPSGDRWLLVDDDAASSTAASSTAAKGTAAKSSAAKGTPAMPIGPYAEPWALSNLVVERRPHVLVVGDARRRADVRRLATDLEKVTGDVRRLWPQRTWNGRVVAYAVTDRRFVSEWFGTQAADGKRDRPDSAASFEARVVSLPGPLREGRWGHGPTRLVVTPYLLGQADPYATSVLRHEVTHVATDRIGGFPPAWLLEGAAEYTGFRLGGTRVDAERTFGRHGVPSATARAMQRGTWRPVLVNDGQAFYRGTSTSVEAAYVDGWLAALYVADRYGDATLRRLYEVACAQPEGTDADAVDAAALRTVLDTDHAAFTAAVRAYGLRLRHQFA